MSIGVFTRAEIRQRSRAIRSASPRILEQLFEMQNRICDLCNLPIQDLVLAVLEHSTPVIYFARNPIPIAEAIRLCNDPGNLRAAHATCNHIKKTRSREEWFALGLDKQAGVPRSYTYDELMQMHLKRVELGRRIGRLGGLRRIALYGNPRSLGRV